MSDSTLTYIRSLQPFLQPYAIYLVDSARAVGVPLIVISGRRNALTNREVGGAERSLHLKGLAFDVLVQGYTVQEIPAWWWGELGALWESVGGRWGGRFTPADVNHFDVGIAALVPA